MTVDRAMTAAVEAACQASPVRPVVFVELDFPEDYVRVCTAILENGVPLQWDGKGWYGVGGPGRMSTLEETSLLSAARVDLQLSGIPYQGPGGEEIFDHVNRAMTSHYFGRSVKIWLGFFDAAWIIIPDPFLIWQGRMDAPEIVHEAKGVTVTMACEHELVDMERPRVLRYTDEDQQSLFPGDLACEYVWQLQEMDIRWGR